MNLVEDKNKPNPKIAIKSQPQKQEKVNARTQPFVALNTKDEIKQSFNVLNQRNINSLTNNKLNKQELVVASRPSFPMNQMSKDEDTELNKEWERIFTETEKQWNDNAKNNSKQQFHRKEIINIARK